MSLHVLIVVTLRVFAIYYATQVISLIPILIELKVIVPHMSNVSGMLLSFGSTALASAILGLFAERIARAVLGNAEPVIAQFSFTLADAYCFAFVFLGLYFVLSSIGATATQLYYFVAIASQTPDSGSERVRVLFDLFKPGITLAVGFAALVGAPIWSRKLTALS